MKVKVGISNRHVHLTDETLKILFGKNYQLDVDYFLSQPAEFASCARVTLKGYKGQINNVRIVGPTRSYNQVEISMTDAIKLGINPPVRNSGDLVGSAPITLVGPCNEVTLKEGCIIATRHIHISYNDLKKLNNKEIVSVKINSEKPAILENVYIKASENAYTELHLDTDDANANLIKQDDEVQIIDE